MLRAFAKLNPVRQKLLICGGGTLRDQLGSLAAELGIADRVQFLGLRRDIPDVMSAADAFALSSDMEGLPLVLLQACAAGLPIVATNVSGNPEVVIEGANGYLTPPGLPEVFAQAMTRMVALLPTERAALGVAGLSASRNCSKSSRSSTSGKISSIGCWMPRLVNHGAARWWWRKTRKVVN